MNRRGWMAAGILAVLYMAAGTYWVVEIAPMANATNSPEHNLTAIG